MRKVTAIIVAAGEGKRFGTPKQFLILKGKQVLEWTIAAFESHQAVDEIILVLNQDEGRDQFQKQYRKIRAVINGGRRRQDSVLNGFSSLDSTNEDLVLVHDGVRPIVGEDLINRVVKAAFEHGAAVPVLPIEDTVKEVKEGMVLRTVSREKLFRVQTPQGFFYSILKQALERAKEDEYYGTDEASLVERIGKQVFVVPGDPVNIKITYPGDMKILEAFLGD